MTQHRHMLVLGGSRHHPGGLEAFCERAVAAIRGAGEGWSAEWLPTEGAYFGPRHLPAIVRSLRALLSARRRVDLVWLQFSTLTDLPFLIAARAVGLPVMVTPHLGANARLQRVGASRRLAVATLRAADRLCLLFDGQDREIALPTGVPQSIVRTFLPRASLVAPLVPRSGDTLRLIHAGRLSEGKGTFRTVALCAALRARGIKVSARIVGRSDAATMATLRQTIATAGLTGEIELIEWVGEAELVRMLGEADVLAHLSMLDSFPLIVLEAMAMGAVPVVADMAGAASMVARYDGHVARGSSSEAAAAEWIAGQSLAQLRDRGSACAAGVRRDFDWRSCAAQAIAAAEDTLMRRAERAS